MKDTLGQLVLVVPPPSKPIESHGDWTAVETALGTALPDDYKAFIEAYGTGAISCELWILNPFTRHKVWNLRSVHRALSRSYDKNVGRPLDGSPLFPQPNGLLVCGTSVDNDQIFWRVRGSPNNWSIAVSDRQMLEMYEFSGMSLTAFLLRLVQRQITEYQIPLINPPYADPNARYEFCTYAESRRMKRDG